MSKFLPLEVYQAPNGSYKLLPFRFERLSDGDLVLTNEVGEFTFLPAAKLEEVVNKRLRPTDEAYADLRAKHIIMEPSDTASLHLLALKKRTKLRNLANFTNLHLFVVTLRCDHSCQYCQVSRQSENKAAFDMSPTVADRALDLVFRSPNPAIKIEFQGGEPLLNFPLIRHIVEKAVQRNEIEQRELQFVITTTLALLTPEILEFCAEHRIFLSSSLDGPADLHNHNRPRPGRDSHARFVTGLKMARDRLGYDSVSALMTTSPASLGRVRDIIDEYLRHGFDGIVLRHLSPYGFAVKTKSYQAYDANRWLDFYREGMEYILELNKKGIFFVEHMSSLMLTKILTSREPGYVDLMNPAGAGVAAVLFNYDGDVYASDEARMLKEMGDTTFRLGNVMEHSYEEIFTNETLLNALEDSFTSSAPMCSQCAFEPWCGADPVFHHAMFGDVLGRKPESDFCARVMGVTHYLLDKLKNDLQAKEIFMRWVRPC